jgi:hypothetical protein
VSLAEFQRELARLVITPEVDPAQRRAWHTAPELSDRERRRLACIADHGGLETARVIHRFFRANALMDGLPLSLRGFRPGEIKPLLARFWQRYAPTSIYNHSESAAFGAFLLAEIEAGVLDNPVLADLLRYELAAIELQAGSQVSSTCELHDARAQAPVCHPGLRAVELAHDPDELLARARAGRPMDGVARRPGFLLLRANPPGPVETAPLLPELGAVLRACDGRRSAVSVAEAIGRPLEELRELAEAGLIAFVACVHDPRLE